MQEIAFQQITYAEAQNERQGRGASEVSEIMERQEAEKMCAEQTRKALEALRKINHGDTTNREWQRLQDNPGKAYSIKSV